MSNCKYCTFNKFGDMETWTDSFNIARIVVSPEDKSFRLDVGSISGSVWAESPKINYCPKCGRKLTVNTNKFQDYTNDLANVLEAKNKDYGNSFDATMNKYGLIALPIRLDDKLSRLTSLTKGKTQHVKDESLRDTLKDIAGYAILGMRYLDNKEENKK